MNLTFLLTSMAAAGVFSGGGSSGGGGVVVPPVTPTFIQQGLLRYASMSNFGPCLGRLSSTTGFTTVPAPGTGLYYVARIPMVLAGEHSALCVSNLAWYLEPLQGVQTAGVQYSIAGMALEIGSQTVALKFNGNSGITLNDGATDVQTDLIYPSSFGLTTFADGTTVYIRMLVAIGSYIPAHRANAAGGQMYICKQTSTVPSYLGTGPMSAPSGTYGVDYVNMFAGIVPIILGIQTGTKRPTFNVAGDSKTYGSEDTMTSLGVIGLSRMLAFSPTVAINGRAGCNWSRPAGDANDMMIGSYWLLQRYWDYGSHALLGFGTNGPSPTKLSQHTVLHSTLRAMGIQQIVQVGLTPRVDNAGNFSSEAVQTQTLFPQWGAGGAAEVYDNGLKAIPTTPDHFMKFYDPILLRGTNRWKWATNGTPYWLTPDGTHENAFAYERGYGQAGTVVTSTGTTSQSLRDVVLGYTYTNYTANQAGYVGANIGFGSTWSPSPYVDLFYSAREAYLPGQTSGTIVPGDAVDDSPTAACRLIVCEGGNNAATSSGTYQVRYLSTSSLAAGPMTNATLTSILQAGGVTTATLTITGPSPTVMLDIGGPAPGMTIKKVGEVQTDLLSSAAVQHYKDFAILRTLDLSTTNNNTTEINWSDRAPAYKRRITEAKGQNRPWEHVIDMANAIHRANGSRLRWLWITIPTNATTAYCTSLANLLDTRLDKGMGVIAECSNEIWNYAFQHSNSLLTQAQAEVAAGGSNLNVPAVQGGSPQYEQARRLHARRTRDMALAMKAVLGKRVRPVLMGQFSNPTNTADAIAWLNTAYPSTPPSTYLWTTGAAPYPQDETGLMESAATATILMNGLYNGFSDSLEMAKARFSAWAGVASTYGLQPPMAYEYGPHTHNQANLTVKRDAHKSAAMGQLVQDIFSEAQLRGWGPMCYYTVSPCTHTNTDVNTLWPSCEQFVPPITAYKHAGLLASRNLPLSV